MSNLSHEFACGSGERGLNRVFTCGVYKCPALLHKWPHKQPVARLGLEQYSVQMRIISPQLTIRPPPAKLWPSSITSRVSLICLLGQLACAWQPDKDIIFRPDFRFHSAGSDVPIKGPGFFEYKCTGGCKTCQAGKESAFCFWFQPPVKRHSEFCRPVGIGRRLPNEVAFHVRCQALGRN